VFKEIVETHLQTHPEDLAGVEMVLSSHSKAIGL
jgi:hypothetical protein